MILTSVSVPYSYSYSPSDSESTIVYRQINDELEGLDAPGGLSSGDKIESESAFSASGEPSKVFPLLPDWDEINRILWDLVAKTA